MLALWWCFDAGVSVLFSGWAACFFPQLVGCAERRVRGEEVLRLEQFVACVCRCRRKGHKQGAKFVHASLHRGDYHVRLRVQKFSHFGKGYPICLAMCRGNLRTVPIARLLLARNVKAYDFAYRGGQVKGDNFSIRRTRALAVTYNGKEFLAKYLSSAPIPRTLQKRFLVFRGGRTMPPTTRTRARPIVRARSAARPRQFHRPRTVPRPRPIQRPRSVPRPRPVQRPRAAPRPRAVRRPGAVPRPRTTQRPRASCRGMRVRSVQGLPGDG